MSGDRYARRNRRARRVEITRNTATQIMKTGGSDMITKFIRTALAVTILATTAALSPPAQAQTAIGVSYQPSLYWALPFYYATQKGWWKEVGLTPNFSTFPAGAPQIEPPPPQSLDV